MLEAGNEKVRWPVDSKRDGLSLSGSQASFPLTTAKREWKRGSIGKREKGLSGNGNVAPCVSGKKV